MRREIGSIFSLCFTVFTLISLISYSAFDIPLYTSSPNSPPLNKAGRIGAYLSEPFLDADEAAFYWAKERRFHRALIVYLPRQERSISWQ